MSSISFARRVAAAGVLLAVSALSLADNAIDTQCKVEQKPKAMFFPEMAAAAIEVRRSVCVRGADEQGVIAAMVTFVESEAKKERLRPFGFGADKNPLNTALAGIDIPNDRFPTLAIAGRGDAINVDADPIAPTDAEACTKAAEKAKAGETCRNALDEFAQLYTYAHIIVEKRGAIAFSKNVEALTQEWDEFMTRAHAQTALELALNSYLYRKHERAVFTSPPSHQIILLHPNFVLENVNAALEGDQTKEALMIELIGMNWWREKAWFIPTGGSLVALYSDRAQTDDVGYGVAIHFKGVYTLGYAYHGSDGGAFISADLLKLFEDKKKIIDSFQP